MDQFVILKDNSNLTVTLQTNLTVQIVPDLQTLFKEEIKNGITKIILDLSKVTIMDSSGIGLIIALCNSINEIKGTLNVTNVEKEIFKMLQLMRLVNRLNVTEKN
jgi:anti-sigma B factor antagonist